jgi:hypothetical protein
MKYLILILLVLVGCSDDRKFEKNFYQKGCLDAYIHILKTHKELITKEGEDFVKFCDDGKELPFGYTE